MDSSTYRFVLDLRSTQSQISLPVLIGDTGRTLRIRLSDGGSQYIIEDGCLAKLSIMRPTGTHLEEFCTIENNTTIVYPFSQNANTSSVEGVHNCDVVLYGLDGKVIGSPSFTMVVSERVIPVTEVMLTDEDFTALDAILAKEAQRQFNEQNRVAAETTRASAETGRVTAEKKRESNEYTRETLERHRSERETNRIYAEKDRVDAEENRVSAEQVRNSSEEARSNAENERKAAEEARVLAESERAKAEESREETAKTLEAHISANIKKGDVDTAVNIAHYAETGEGAKDKYTLAQGMHTIANGYASFAEGYGNIAGDSTEEPVAFEHEDGAPNGYEGWFTHAEGNGTWAKGVGCHTEGYKTRATDDYSHAEGYESYTNAAYSHVEGKENKITDSGICGHAEGYKTGVSGKYGHAEGYRTKAIGKASHAGGYGTEARGEAQTVVGRYNKDNNDALFVVGDGTDEDNRHNAFEVISNGNGCAIKVGDTMLTEDVIIALQADICFQEGTTILMADRTYKAIEDVKYGDMIMTYDIDTNELVPCKSFGCLPTGYAHSWNHYCFDNGSVLKIFGGHRVYNADKQSLVYFSKLEIGDHCIASNCDQATYCYSPTKVPAAVSTRKYTIFCETGLYFANDILCGHPICQPLDIHIRTHGAVKLSEEDKAIIQAYADARDNEYLVEMQNKEYIAEALPIWKEQQTARRMIAECKDKLAKRDYKTIKAMQGKLTEEELSENIIVCDELRTTINNEELVVADNEAKIKVLQEKHNVHPRPLQTIETLNVRSAIAKARQKYT